MQKVNGKFLAGLVGALALTGAVTFMVIAEANELACCADAPEESSAAKSETNETPGLLTCSLSSKEQAELRDTAFEEFRAAADEIRKDTSGYSVRYASDRLEEILTFIEIERDCCAFLTFNLTFEPDGGPLWLSVSGPPAAHDQLAAMYEAFDAAKTTD